MGCVNERQLGDRRVCLRACTRQARFNRALFLVGTKGPVLDRKERIQYQWAHSVNSNLQKRALVARAFAVRVFLSFNE